VAVIVTAFNRREYFAEAVESVLREGAGPIPFECLLLRNFEEPAVDARLTDRGVRLVPDFSPDVGGTLYCALDHCDADYLAFVDDDDLVLPHHLSRFSHVLERVPDLVYYHNEYATFATSTGSPPGVPSAPGMPRPRSDTPWSAYRATDGELFLRFLAVKNRERNLSSTILHRSVLERARPELSAVAAMTDTAALVAGLSSGGRIVFDDEVTTLVRRHRENISRTLTNSRRRAADLDLFSRLVARSPNAGITREYLELRRARETVYTRVFGVPSSSRELRRAARTLRDYWNRLGCWRDLGFLGLGAAALAAPLALPVFRPLLVPR
jgi:glycosyltransferase involved in cell wall biosynthesis